MPTLEIKQLFAPVVLPAAAAVLYTMPTAAVAPGAVLKNGRVRLSNTTAAPLTATLYADVAATASGPGNVCFPTKAVPANDYVDVDLPTLKAGDTLRGFAGAAASITMQELGGVIYYP